jgi:hypothetical protein
MSRQSSHTRQNKVQKQDDFVSTNQKAKSSVVAQFVRIARKERLDYGDFVYVCQQVRRKLRLLRPHKQRKLPELMPEAARCDHKLPTYPLVPTVLSYVTNPR